MSADGVTQLDHAPNALSTAPSEGERDNAVRFKQAPRAHTRGHVESHFLKANSPDGTRALWIKHTLLVPARAIDRAVAELWAVAFAERGRRKWAQKQTFPIAAASFGEAPFSFRLPCAELAHGRALGALGTGDTQIEWSLRYEPPERGFRPFPLARMYGGRFPRTKSLTPGPDLRVHGSFRAFGELWSIDGWRGAQGHNWGTGHAHAYAWVHANAWVDEESGAPCAGVWLEALTGKVRLGPLVTPWLSVAGLALDGRVLRFDRLRALGSRRIRIDARSYQFQLTQGDAAISGAFRADPEQLAGLCYRDPDGSSLACLNSKLAHGQLRVCVGGRTRRLRTDQAALELGTRAPNHGIPILA